MLDVQTYTRGLLGTRFASSGRRARRSLGARARRSFCRVLPLALLSMLAPAAIAHYAPGDCNDGFGYCFNVTTGEYEWFDAKDPCKGGHQSGDPVDTFSGSFVHGVVDLSIPGRGLDVEIRRSYRSTGQMNGPFGYNWSFNYNVRAVHLDNGSWLIRGEEGHELVFHATGTNSLGESTYCGCEIFKQLVAHANGTLTLFENDGHRMEFNAEGTLRAIGDRFGNEIQFEYAQSGGLAIRKAIQGKSKYFLRTGSGVIAREYQLVKIIDTYSREITFDYYTSADGLKEGRVKQIVDFGGRTVRYDYDDNGNLTSVTSPQTDEFPAGVVTQYGYASGQANEALNHNLTSITDARGNLVLTTVYDTSDRVQSQTFGGGTTTWSYDTVNSRTTVTDGNGNVSQMTFNTSGQPISTKRFTRGLRPGEPAFFETTQQYDANQDLTRTVLPNGSAVEYGYDAKGNVLEVRREPVGGDMNGADDIVESSTYEPIYNQVLTTTDPLGRVTTYTFDYQEANDTAGLALRLGVSQAEIASRLAAASIPMNLGDVNADGRTDQIGGAIIRAQFPNVTVEGSPQTVESLTTYNDRGQVLSTRSPENRLTTFDHHPENDPDGDGVPVPGQSGSDPTGYPSSVTSGEGTADETTTHMTYDAFGLLRTLTDGRGAVSTLEHDERNLLVRVVSAPPFSYQILVHHDENGNVASIEVENKDRNNVQVPANPWLTSTYTHDDMNRVLTHTAEIDSTHDVVDTFTYDDNGNLTQVTRPAGNVVRFEYDERDLLLKARRGFGTSQESVATYNYDLNGNLSQVVDANSKSATATYDGFDRLAQVTNALGHVLKMSYDKASRTTLVEGRNSSDLLLSGSVVEYDELGRPVRQDRQLVNTSGQVADVVSTHLVYDRDDLPTKVTDDNGKSAISVYDAVGRLVESRDELNNAFLYTRDDNGNVLTSTSRNRDDQTSAVVDITTTYAYDALNRITTFTDALGKVSTAAYDSRSNPVFLTDRAGNTVTRNFDGLGRVLSTVLDVRDAGGTIVDTVTRAWTYDANSRLLEQLDDNGSKTRYGYDPLDRIASRTWAYQTPSAASETYTYDGADNRLTRLDANGTTTTYGYDDLNRLTSRTGGGVTETYQYDPLNRLTQAVLQSGVTTESTVAFTYDSLGRPLSETQNALAVVRQYDGVGNRTRLDYPGAGFYVTETPNALNRLALIQDPSNAVIADYDYLGASFVTRRAHASGRKLVRSYDGLGRVVDLQHQDGIGALIKGFRYGYDRQGNRLFEERLHDAGVGDAYKYDSLYRLVRGWSGASAADILAIKNAIAAGTAPPDPVSYTGSTTYSLDGVGNRLIVDRNGTPEIYSPNAHNQYATVGGVSQVHDPGGNLTDDGTFLFTYDRENRLTEVRQKAGGALVVNYVYDALGRRIEKRFPSGARTVFLYDEGRLIEERDELGAVTAQYVYGAGIDEILLMRRGGQDYLFHEDDLGSIVAVTNSAGALVEQYRYDHFGSVSMFNGLGGAIGASAIGNPWLYTGRQLDPETGLYHNRRRFLDPDTGRFLSRDPLGMLDGMNLYAYVNNNPINFIDPFGLEGTRPRPPVSRPPDGALETGLKAAWGALKGFGNMFVEAGKNVYDMGMGGVDVVGKKTGLYNYDHDYVSAIGQAAEQGAGTGDILVGMGKGIIQTPQRLIDAAERGDAEAFGEEGLNLYMVGRGAQQLLRSGVRGAQALRAGRGATGAAGAAAEGGAGAGRAGAAGAGAGGAAAEGAGAGSGSAAEAIRPPEGGICPLENAPTRAIRPYYPPNRGFSGPPKPTTLKPGTIIDRYGGPNGSFASPQGTPPGARALPYGVEARPLNAYEVVKPLPVDAGPAAPWFGQWGGGMQYDLGASVQQLIDGGFLRPIP